MNETIKHTNTKQQDNFTATNRLFPVLKQSINYGFIALLVIDGLVAGIWTLIPTAYLPWGASKTNYMGYVSHCSFAPLSSIMLLGIAGLGMFLAFRLKMRNLISYSVIAAGMISTIIGMLDGLNIQLFVINGLGTGIGVIVGGLLGAFQGLKRKR